MCQRAAQKGPHPDCAALRACSRERKKTPYLGKHTKKVRVQLCSTQSHRPKTVTLLPTQLEQRMCDCCACGHNALAIVQSQACAVEVVLACSNHPYVIIISDTHTHS